MSIHPSMIVVATMLLAAGCNAERDNGSAQQQAAAQTSPETTIGADRAEASKSSDASATKAADTPDGSQAFLRRSDGDSPYLVDQTGMPLYVLRRKAEGFGCDASCQNIWPPVLSNVAQPSVAADLDQAKVGSLSLPGGVVHVTYDGHPLYRYGGDRGATAATGHDVQDHWGHWSLVFVDQDESTRPSAN